MKATRFAEIDPEEFYDFTQTRPNTFLLATGARRIQWPANEFYYWQDSEGDRDLLFFVGVEPNLRWRTYSGLVVDIMERCGCGTILHLGALLDAVPHTRETRLSGSSSDEAWRKALSDMGAPPSNYQGPTGITSAVMEVCKQKGYSYSSVWGHAPHYLHATPNFKVSHALLTVVDKLLSLSLDLTDIRRNATAFDHEVGKAVEQDAQIQAYVQRLEEHYDRIFFQPKGAGENLTPQEVLRELEEFLKQEQRRKNEDGESGDKDSPEA
jgi:proteasome assembly chaperone (PAC2) family protein